MTRKPFPAAFLCLAALGVAAPAVETRAQQLYKCVQPNGKVVYQQDKCDDTQKQSTVRPPDPVAAKTEEELKAASSRDAKAADMQMGQIIQVISDASLCVNQSKGWDEKNGGLLREWKGRNGQMVAKFDQDQDARAKAAARLDSEAARYAGKQSDLDAKCESVAAALRKSSAAKN